MQIATHTFDGHYWTAVDDDTYGGDGWPCGSGLTEAEAITDLVEQLEDCAP